MAHLVSVFHMTEARDVYRYENFKTCIQILEDELHQPEYELL